jgi:hypothetical protein
VTCSAIAPLHDPGCCSDWGGGIQIRWLELEKEAAAECGGCVDGGLLWATVTATDLGFGVVGEG